MRRLRAAYFGEKPRPSPIDSLHRIAICAIVAGLPSTRTAVVVFVSGRYHTFVQNAAVAIADGFAVTHSGTVTVKYSGSLPPAGT